MARVEADIGVALSWDGGDGHDLQDPGAETKFGVHKRRHAELHMAALTMEQAKVMYRRSSGTYSAMGKASLSCWHPSGSHPSLTSRLLLWPIG